MSLLTGFVSLLLSTSVWAAPTSGRNHGLEKAGLVQGTHDEVPVIGALNGIEIHDSCNSSQVHQLTAGFADAHELALNARDHLLNKGRDDPIYRRYFGDASSAEVIGWYDRILYANKTGVIFRCDDPDGQCAHEKTWAGHYRGSNATSETVICDNSYLKRQRLEQMCTQGYNVSGGNTNLFWASDLMHRLFHIPAVTEEAVGHYADEFDTSIELAKKNATVAVRNSDSLQYFALEVYAFDVAVPGEGCLGLEEEEKEEPKTEEPKKEELEKGDGKDGKECHFHADGSEHCT
ncbi:zincin [Ascodesmis nigricans]|uniref:Zincin n=1 Tax=Ascodesmis nigricans TaxID=341454 RepID=A0A4S2MWK7_9PEZI|nr:zincin [Ascodesmis nigricans]